MTNVEGNKKIDNLLWLHMCGEDKIRWIVQEN